MKWMQERRRLAVGRKGLLREFASNKRFQFCGGVGRMGSQNEANRVLYRSLMCYNK